jgi:hypothetical protein
MRTYYTASADGFGIPKTASTFEEIESWVKNSKTAKGLLQTNGFILIHKVVNYEVPDPNSKPVPFKDKTDTSLLATAHYNYGIITIEKH